MIHTLKALIEPFNDNLKTSSEEDDKMAAVIDNAQVKLKMLNHNLHIILWVFIYFTLPKK